MAALGGTQHSEYETLSALAGYGVRAAGVAGLLSDAEVAAATSAEDLVANLDSFPGTSHIENEFTSLNAQLALKRGDAIGDFSNSRIAAATTVEEVASLTFAEDEADQRHLGPRIV